MIAVGHPNFILKTLRKESFERGFSVFKSHPDELNAGNEWRDILCSLDRKEFRADFHLQQMPGCCAVLIISYVHVKPYNQERFDEVLQTVEAAAFQAGFGSVVMTQTVPDHKQRHWRDYPWIVCLKRGWKSSEPFKNAKSGNLVVYLTKDLKQPGKKQGLELLLIGEL